MLWVCAYLEFSCGHTYASPPPPLLAAEVFSRTVTGSNLGDKNPHDFPSMDLNLGKHFVMCKLFLNRTERFRSAIQDLVCWESPKIDCCLGSLARNRHVELTEKGEKAGGGVPWGSLVFFFFFQSTSKKPLEFKVI